MNSFRAISAALALAMALCLPARAEDWTTTDGKVYKDVKVLKLEDDAVTILDSEGGALVPLATLPPELQARFKYDPAKARAAAATRAQADAENPAALEAERVEAAKLKAARDAKYAAAKKAIDDAKAAAAAAEPKADPLHVSNFDLGKTDDTRTHYKLPDALSTNGKDNPVTPAP